jgi:nitroreductase/FMN reductase [NAD(P)H]
MTLGHPSQTGRITARLPLDVTVHVDRFEESQVQEKIDAYDQRRHALQPYRKQRYSRRYEPSAFYGWSEDKARHYSVPERAGFGAYIRKQGFTLD